MSAKNQVMIGNNNIQAGGDIVMGETRPPSTGMPVVIDVDARVVRKRLEVSDNVFVHAQTVWRQLSDDGVHDVYGVVSAVCRVDEVQDDTLRFKAFWAMFVVAGMWLMNLTPLYDATAVVAWWGVMTVLLLGLLHRMGRMNTYPVRRTKRAMYEEQLLRLLAERQVARDAPFVAGGVGSLTGVEQ